MMPAEPLRNVAKIVQAPGLPVPKNYRPPREGHKDVFARIIHAYAMQSLAGDAGGRGDIERGDDLPGLAVEDRDVVVAVLGRADRSAGSCLGVVACRHLINLVGKGGVPGPRQRGGEVYKQAAEAG